jgi:hypothetical protein
MIGTWIKRSLRTNWQLMVVATIGFVLIFVLFNTAVSDLNPLVSILIIVPTMVIITHDVYQYWHSRNGMRNEILHLLKIGQQIHLNEIDNLVDDDIDEHRMQFPHLIQHYDSDGILDAVKLLEAQGILKVVNDAGRLEKWETLYERVVPIKPSKEPPEVQSSVQS